MQFDNQKTRNVADIVAKILAGETVSEELKGDQHKIDANKNNKIDAHDFKMLRAKKKVEEETELTESHFKVGDEVICKASGMEGEVVKVDPKEEGKYYTVKREDGKMIKYAPDELKLEDEDEEEDDKKEMKESEQLQEYEAKGGVYRHKGTYGYAGKGAEHGETDFKKANDDEKAADKKSNRKKYGARQNYVRAYAKESFSGMLDLYKEAGLKGLMEAYGKKKVMKEEPTNDEFTAELEDQKAKAAGKKKQPDLAKGDVMAVKNEETVEVEVVIDASNGYDAVTIGERSLTEPEMKKKEEVVKSMKKGMAGFKDRYGDRAKEVMYATATKIAKKD
jgi:preprotein translocase subunit YajC